MPENNLRGALLLSTIIHSVTLLFLWNRSSTFINPSAEDVLLQIHWRELEKERITTQSPTNHQNQKGKQNQQTQKSISEKIELNDLKPSLLGKYHTWVGYQESQQKKGEFFSQPILETMDKMGLSEYSENHYFFETLKARLHESIDYPREYALHKIQGSFWVQILVNHKGQLLQIIESSKQNPLLCAYVILNIHQSLKTNFPSRYWYTKDKTLAFHLNFDFQVTSSPHSPGFKAVHSVKNRIDFLRVEKIPDFLHQVTTDYARYFPPIAPTPLGPVVNFVQVYKMIRSWQNLDPLERKKTQLELTTKRIDALLKRAQSEHR